MVQNRMLPPISPELRFVLNCANYSESYKETILPPSINWKLVLQLSLNHGLFPLVYKTLNNLDSQTVPEYVITTLRERCLKNALCVVGLTNEIIRIIKTMEEYGIQLIILKGSPLSVKINEDITFRPSSDIDILVDPQEFERAEQILEQMGYTRYSPDFRLTPRQEKAYFTSYHHFEYFHTKRGISVELHWRIRSSVVKNFPDAAKLSIQKISVTGCLVPVMDDEYWLLYLMIHGYKHYWARLRWLYDVKQLMEMPIEWDKIINQANDSELRPILHQSLILANQLFAVPVPDCLKHSVAADRKAWKLADTVINEFLINKSLDYASNSKLFKKKINVTKIINNLGYLHLRWKDKLEYLFSLFKPGHKEFKLITLPDTLYVLYYVIKPFYWLRRRIILSKMH